LRGEAEDGEDGEAEECLTQLVHEQVSHRGEVATPI